VDANHAIIGKTIEEEVNSLLKKIVLRQLIRKNLIFLVDKFQIFLLQKIFLEK
jgi:hypothetical protein